jgi:hypothetical protein
MMLLLSAVATAAVAVGAGRLARQAWGWGDAMPARFRGLQDLYRIAPAMAVFCGGLAVFFGFLAATHGALDGDGTAATWQLVVVAPVGVVAAVGCLSVLTIPSWRRPRLLIPPALRGEETRVREEPVAPAAPPRSSAPGVDGSVPDDVDARPWRRGDDPRFAGDRERRRRRELATAMFAIPMVFAAIGTVLGVGARGDGGIVSPGFAFAAFIGVGAALSTYGALILTGWLPSVLHGAIPRRTAGIAVLTVGAGAFTVGAAAAGTVVAIAGATAGPVVFCALAVRETRPDARSDARSAGALPRVAVLVLGAVLWSAVAVLALS